MRNKKAFTLIELIAVLVILAILALIVTPLVMNIINKAKTSANKRSIDAYGRSIELAIASHMLDTGEIPTSIDELTIEYSGDEVVCETTQINSDSTVYLAGCTVGGKAVEGYTYGKDNTTTYDAYSVGDQVTYNNVDYYVIKDSGAKEELVTLLKAEPLTVAEVNEYGGVGTQDNHVKGYVILVGGSTSYYEQAYDVNNDGTLGGMAYYSSATCGYDGNNSWQHSGCTNAYADSEIKYVVDAWKIAKAPASIQARLISSDDFENLGYEWKQTCPTCSSVLVKTDEVPVWFYNDNYWYWTDIQHQDEPSTVALVDSNGNFKTTTVYYATYHDGNHVVRPVITISKSALQN